MIRLHNHFSTSQVGSELVHGEYYYQELLFRCGLVELGSGQCLTCVGYSIVLLISTLTEHCAYGVVACIAHDLERKFPIVRLNDGCGYECLLEGVEGHEAFLNKVEWASFASRLVKGLAIREKSLMNLL